MAVGVYGGQLDKGRWNYKRNKGGKDNLIFSKYVLRYSFMMWPESSMTLITSNSQNGLDLVSFSEEFHRMFGKYSFQLAKSWIYMRIFERISLKQLGSE